MFYKREIGETLNMHLVVVKCFVVSWKHICLYRLLALMNWGQILSYRQCSIIPKSHYHSIAQSVFPTGSAPLLSLLLMIEQLLWSTACVTDFAKLTPLWWNLGQLLRIVSYLGLFWMVQFTDRENFPSIRNHIAECVFVWLENTNVLVQFS